MALHAARAIRQRHKAIDDHTESDISPEQRRNLEEAFEAADKNGDGVLSADEYYEIFQTHGLTIDKEWIQKTIAQNDKDGDGGISLEEFIEMNIRGKMKNSGAGASGSSHSRPSTIVEKAKLAFNVYDRNRDGYLTKAELRKTSKRMTDAQIDAVFEKYDKNKDGKLDFSEFKDLMEARSKSQEEEERTVQHQKHDKVQQQHSAEKRASFRENQPSSPRRRLDRSKLSSHMSIDRESSPRSKSSVTEPSSPPKI